MSITPEFVAICVLQIKLLRERGTYFYGQQFACEAKGLKHFYKTRHDISSKIDLDQDTRFITVFESGTRIKRFKRLIFGVNSAAEEL